MELYKYDGATFTLISSGATNPEAITGGTVVDLYVSALAVPSTVLAATDRLAIRIFVTTSGRNITLHTEDNNLCQIITTFTTGLNALNGLTAQVQNFATGTSGTDFGITSATDTHTFNLPTASASNRGALSSSDWSTFNGKFNTPTGTTAEYIRGDGSLNTFPTIPAQFNPSAGTGISISGSYPNQTFTNTAPDQTVSLTAGTGIAVSGTYPSFTISNTSSGPVIYKSTTDGTAITGVAGEQITASQLIPANTFAVGDIIRVTWRVTKTGTASSLTCKLYANSSASLSGATQLGIITPGFTNSNSNGFQRHLAIKASNNTQVTAPAGNTFTDFNTLTSFTAANIDWTANQYLIFMVQLSSASADVARTSFYLIEKI
jgi:hypothetical protein